jgi:hypothetical protein
MSNEGEQVQLGAIVAERTFEAFRADGRNVLMTVRLGRRFESPLTETTDVPSRSQESAMGEFIPPGVKTLSLRCNTQSISLG